jgi:hypothetical protein
MEKNHFINGFKMLLSAAFAFCVQSAHSMQNIEESKDFRRIGEIACSLGEGTVVVFDFDGVLMKQREDKLVDESTPEVLQRLKDNNIPFFCITNNYDACSDIRSNQFLELGLIRFFDKPFLLEGRSSIESPYFLRTDCNTVFASTVIPQPIPVGAPEDALCRFHRKNQVRLPISRQDRSRHFGYFQKHYTAIQKGEALKQMIADGVLSKPKHLVFVDDNKENVTNFRDACLGRDAITGLGIDFRGIHFTADPPLGIPPKTARN